MLGNIGVFKQALTKYVAEGQAYFQVGYKDGKILYPLSGFMQRNPDITEKLASVTFTSMLQNKIATEEQLTNMPSNYLATYGFLLSGLVFAYDTVAEKNVDKQFALYTASISVLKTLASKGMLLGSEGKTTEQLLEGFEKTLYQGSVMTKTIKEGLGEFQCYRLDPEYDWKGNLKLKVTGTGGNRPSMGQFEFVPYRGVKDVAWLGLKSIADKRILAITMQIPTGLFDAGTKTRTVTVNETALQMLFGEERAKQMLKVSRAENIFIKHLYMPVIGASSESLGCTRIYLEYIRKIELLDASKIDLKDTNRDLTMIPRYFQMRLEATAKKDPSLLTKVATQLGAELSPNPDELLQNIYGKVDHMKKHELWKLMNTRGYKGIFKPENFDKYPSIIANAKSVHRPKTAEEFTNMLNTGLYKVVFMRKRGTLGTAIVTNNDGLLRKYKGRDYIARYESKGRKGACLSYILQHNDVVDAERIYDIIGEHSTDREYLKYKADLLIEDANMYKKRELPEGVVRARSIESLSPGDRGYYVEIGVNMIQSIQRLE